MAKTLRETFIEAFSAAFPELTFTADTQTLSITATSKATGKQVHHFTWEQIRDHGCRNTAERRNYLKNL